MGIFTDRRNKKGNGLDTQADNVARHIHNRLHVFHHTLVNFYEQMMEQVWNHPDLTPEEVFEAFGDKSEELVKSAQLIEQFIEFTAPHRIYKKPEGVSLRIKPNGDVEVIRE